MYIVHLTCGNCHEPFDYSGKEFKRQTEKHGRTVFYCSRSCACKSGNKRKQADPIYKEKQSAHLRKVSKEYFETHKKKFAYELHLCNKRSHKCEVTITEKDLNDLWDRQDGKCALTGIQMTMRESKKDLRPTTVSVDRISSDLGYTPDNIQLVCYSMNLAKNQFLNEVMLDFIKMIGT